MQWDTVRGNGPAFWLLSTRHATVGDAWPNVNPYCAQPRTAEGAVSLRRDRHLRGLREHQRRLPE